ncbi:WD40 repeat domain-containing protein [Helicobacter burdigaliensis]|uniref:WD40 repeat domain-containing protein n=1 Tax=Helicobacter burdigaliensis TaxID=2315334 RepID=UPI000EF6C90E|nr:WD40 repeat domain-containing protein [Helicobacter burdigaliensis]
MFPIKNKLHLIGSVLAISSNKESILCMDNLYNVCVFNKTNMTLEENLKLSKNAEPMHYFSKCVAISNYNSKVAVGIAKSPKAIVLNAQKTIAPIATLTWQKLEISTLVFSKNDSYLATGGEDGRVLIYEGDSFQLLLSLPPFPDYISTICFSEDESLVFASCFHKSAMIFDVEKNILVCNFELDSIIEDAFFYEDNKKLFGVCKDGSVFVYDIVEKKLLLQNQISKVWLTTTQKINEDYAIVGAKDTLLRIIRLSDGALIDTILLDNPGVSSMYQEGDLLYVGGSDGSLQIADLNKSKEAMLETLEKNDLKTAMDLILKENIFLKISKDYIHKVETLWKDTLKEAIELLSKDKMEEASNLVAPFMLDRYKKEEFDYYWQQKENVAKFNDAILEKNYQEAYKLAELHPYLKESLAYANIEELWEKSFEVSKRLLAQNAELNTHKAQELLRPFMQVKGKKETIMMLLRNVDKYLQADKEYKAKNFVEYFKLCERFSFLKETTLFKSALFIGEQIMQKVAILEDSGDYAKALEVCKFLSSMPPFKQIANDKTERIKIKQEFLNATKEHKLAQAFAFTEEYPELKGLKEGKALYENFKNKTKAALSYANAGDGKGVLDCLKEYLYIDLWKDKIASILKIAYLNEFLAHSPKKETKEEEKENISWEETFGYYIERYGKDEELKKVAQEMELEEVIEKIPLDGNTKGYLTAIIADSLISIDNQPLQEHKQE